MSVINKMLRDLDSRQAASKIPFQAEESVAGRVYGTLRTSDSIRTGRRWRSSRFWTGLAAAFMVLGAAAGAGWYLQQNEFLKRKVDLARRVSIPAKSALVIAVAPGPALAAISSPVPVPSDPANDSLKSTQATPPVDAKLPLPVTTAKSGIPPADISLKMDSTFKWLPRMDKPASLSAVATPRISPEHPPTERAVTGPVNTPVIMAPATASVVPQSPSHRPPALEALAQAQSLWNTGSREAAIHLVSDALVVAERASLAGSGSGNNSVLSSLARELARMDLAEGRMSEALVMLTRLEPALSGFADIWAMRGNAAQRMGKHEESAMAYLTALKLRPNEPRWMLGAAVSLAAQGKTAAAAELAEKARAAGVLSPEVETYLRQLGVPLRER